jgi:hypothetical protein
LRARNSSDEIYFEAWVAQLGTRERVDYIAPISCSMVTDLATGVRLENTCTLEQMGGLAITVVDFLRDLQQSDVALSLDPEKSDGFGDGVCTTAEVVVGGVGGLVTTLLIYYPSLIESFLVGVLGGPMIVSTAGLTIGVMVFALSAVGTAWAVDAACDALGVGEPGNQLGLCVFNCADNDDSCVTDCVVGASTDEGLAAGHSECVESCTEDSACPTACDTAFGEDGKIRQTLLMQCVIGCGQREEACAQVCLDAVNLAIPE